MRIEITEAQFAELTMLYMTRHKKLSIDWGGMAALSQLEATPTLVIDISTNQCTECGSNAFLVRHNSAVSTICAHCEAPTTLSLQEATDA